MLKKVNKLKKNIIRLQFEFTEKIDKVWAANIEWEEIYSKLTIHKSKYEVVVHEIFTKIIDLNKEHEETLKQWEIKNVDK